MRVVDVAEIVAAGAAGGAAGARFSAGARRVEAPPTRSARTSAATDERHRRSSLSGASAHRSPARQSRGASRPRSGAASLRGLMAHAERYVRQAALSGPRAWPPRDRCRGAAGEQRLRPGLRGQRRREGLLAGSSRSATGGLSWPVLAGSKSSLPA